jgi:transposase
VRAAEQKLLGFAHDQVGRLLTERWKLPVRLSETIGCHHRPDLAQMSKPGGGRKPIAPRRVFEGIVYVLRTGCQWKALPKERYGSPSSVHKYFRIWLKEGLFLKLWQVGLAEYDEMEGIAWTWQSIDGAMVKAPLAQEGVGKNPTDRGKKWKQAAYTGRRAWRPAVDSRNRSEQT